MFDPIGWLPFRKLRLRNRSVMVVSAVWLLSGAGPFAGPAGASIITTGDVDPGGAATQPDPWAVGANLYVGKTGTGALNVAAGGVVSSSHGYLGYSGNSSSGEVTVTGSGSQWTSAGNTFVGYEGNGELTISNGASASYVWSRIRFLRFGRCQRCRLALDTLSGTDGRVFGDGRVDCFEWCKRQQYRGLHR
jgi:T5SS/PEP-CTERM-associated repeat protein